MTVRRTGYAIPPFTHRRRKEAIDASHTQARRKTTEFLHDLRTASSPAPVECRTKPARTERTASGLMWAISINIAKTILACALLHQQSVRPDISPITLANSATGGAPGPIIITIPERYLLRRLTHDRGVGSIWGYQPTTSDAQIEQSTQFLPNYGKLL